MLWRLGRDIEDTDGVPCIEQDALRLALCRVRKPSRLSDAASVTSVLRMPPAGSSGRGLQRLLRRSVQD